jgi:hypothetical protein
MFLQSIFNLARKGRLVDLFLYLLNSGALDLFRRAHGRGDFKLFQERCDLSGKPLW